MKNRILSLILCLVFVFTLIPESLPAFAGSGSQIPTPMIGEGGREEYIVNMDFNDTSVFNEAANILKVLADNGVDSSGGINADDIVFSDGKMYITGANAVSTGSDINHRIPFPKIKDGIDTSLVYKFKIYTADKRFFDIWFSDGPTSGSSKNTAAAHLEFKSGGSYTLYDPTGISKSGYNDYEDSKGYTDITVEFLMVENVVKWNLWLGTSLVDGSPFETRSTTKTLTEPYVAIFGTKRRAAQNKDIIIDDFKIYKSAYTDEKMGADDKAALEAYMAKNYDPDVITEDMLLPSSGEKYASTIEWSSTNTNIISNDGKVTRPTDADTIVTLTASIKRGGKEITTASFPYNVKLQMTDAACLAADMAWLDSYRISDEALNSVTKYLSLPTEGGEYGSTISWESTKPDIISSDGYVKADRRDDVTLNLKATLKYKNETDTKLYENIKVLKSNLPRPAISGGSEVYAHKLNFNGFSSEDKPIEELPSNITFEDAVFEADKLKIINKEQGSKKINLVHNITDRLVIEFDLARGTAADAQIFLSGSSGSTQPKYSKVNLNIASNLIGYYKGNNSVKLVDYTDTIKPVHIMLRFDKTDESTVDGNLFTYSIWIDGEKKLSNMEPYNGKITSLSAVDALFVRTLDGGTDYLTIDNLRVFEAEATDDDYVSYDKMWLTSLINTTYELDLIKSNLTLPTSGELHGSKIEWISSDENVVASDGTVTRPAADTANANVTLTAKLTKGTASRETKFNLTVVKEISDSDTLDADIEWLNTVMSSGEPLDGITKHMSLPKKGGVYGSDITWESTNEAVISKDGYVKADRRTDTELKLTATLSFNNTQRKASYDVKVLKSNLSRPVLDTGGKEVYLYNLNFNEYSNSDNPHEQMQGYWDTRDSVGKNASFADSKLKIPTPELNSISYVLNFPQDIDDRLVYEFDLARESAASAQIFLMRSGSVMPANSGVNLILSDDKITPYSDNAALSNIEYTNTDKPIHIMIRFDKTDDTSMDNNKYVWSMWIDGELKVDKKLPYQYVSKLSQLGNIAFRTTSGETALIIDNFRVFQAEMSPEEKVKSDYDWLTEDIITSENITAVSNNINLPTRGKSGSKITWTIDSDEEVVKSDGTVIRSEEKDVKVKLTADIFCEAEGSFPQSSSQKIFNITVKKYSRYDKASADKILIDDTLCSATLPKLLVTESGTIEPSEYGLKLTAGDKFSYSFDEQNTGYTEILAYEFSAPDDTKLSFYDTSETLCFGLKTEGGKIYYQTKAPDGVAWRETGSINGEKLHILMDPMSGSFSLWLGNEQIASNVPGVSPASKISKMVVEKLAGTGYFKDLDAFTAIVPHSAALQFDAAYLELSHITWQNPNRIVEDIPLPQTGRCGTEISWETDENIILADGTLVAASDTVNPTSIKATLSNGGETIVKSFNITVTPVAFIETPELKKGMLEESFDSNTIKPDNKWTISQANGIVASKEEALFIIRDEFGVLDDDGNAMPTGAELLYDPMGIYLQGIYCSEFTVRAKDDSGLCIRLRGDGDYCAMNFFNLEGYVNIYQRILNADGEYEQNVKRIDGVGDAAHFKVLFYTADSTFSVWINGKLAISKAKSRTTSPGGIRSAYFYLDGNRKGHIELDNIKFYECYPLHEDRVEMDYNYLTEASVSDKTDLAIAYGKISKNLTLPTKGIYGSNIIWQSMDESVIKSDGTIAGTSSEKTVSLKATISSGDAEPRVKTLTFTVIPSFASDDEAIEADLALLTQEVLAKHENGSANIKRSLNFTPNGAFGSSITWTTSDEEHITKSGRVIRPRFDEADAPVIVTATLKRGTAIREKTFNFNVLKDEIFQKPAGTMEDSEFFGVWNGNSWTTEAKLDYSFEGLQKLEAIVKTIGTSGDYTKAKEELLRYFREDRIPHMSIEASSRQKGWANMLADDFYHLQNGQYYQGEYYITNEWKTHNIPVKTAEISPGNNVSFSLRSWYNESSWAEIVRTNSLNSSLRPKLKLTINDTQTVYIEAADDANIRAGSYMQTNLNNEEYLKLQTFGDFLDDDTRHAVIRFNITGVAKGDTITAAELVLHARAVPEFSGKKRIIILKEPTSTWDSSTVVWNSFLGKIYSFNGLPEKNHWQNVDGADGEYQPQSNRFLGWGALAAEYMVSKDESYAYKTIRIMEDFITDTATWRSLGTADSSSKQDPNGIRGAYKRTLDAVGRSGNWASTIDLFFSSRYATPEFATEVLKNIWDTGNYLSYYNTSSGNWRQYEFQCLLNLAQRVPEFKDSRSGRNWYELGKAEIERMFLQLNSLTDGSYKEACDSYAGDAYTGFVDFKASMIADGGDTSAAYTDRLSKMSYYISSLYAPDGSGIQWGDAGASTRSKEDFLNMARWQNDKNLEYIVTLGASGTEPKFTSQYFPESTVASLRDNWTTSSPWLFTHARGGGQHGHRDSNQIVLWAYGRNLLTDAGIFSYTGTDPYRQWGISSVAHNTVLINDTSQKRADAKWDNDDVPFANTATKYGFSTNDGFDYLSQSTPQTAGFDHRRTITYIKPDIFIVSDLIEPDNLSAANNYKQLWHMQPAAAISVSDDEHIIKSNYATGANIILASAEGAAASAKLETKDAWYDRGYQVLENSPYGYFEKNNARGNTTLDTAIMVSNNDMSAKLKASKLSDTSDTSKIALKLEFTKNNSDYIGYYYMRYTDSDTVYTIVDGTAKFTTDAKLSYVQVNSRGEIVSYLIKDGSYIKAADGSYIFKADSKVGEFQINVTSMDVYANGSDDALGKNIEAFSTVNVSKLFFNDEAKGFSIDGKLIKDIGKSEPSGTGTSKPPAPSQGITPPADSGTSGGGAGGSGGGGGGSIDDTTDTGKDDTTDIDNGNTTDNDTDTDIGGNVDGAPAFADTRGHWAEAYIAKLKDKNIVQGSGDGSYNPDNTITRAEFVAMVVRAVGYTQEEYADSYNDISDSDWFSKVVQTALENKLISPADNFRPHDNITREEMAKIISMAAKLNEHIFPSDLDIYIDRQHISDWAKYFIGYVTQSGLMGGYTDGSFGPLKNATRAETAAVISRMLEWISLNAPKGVNS